MAGIDRLGGAEPRQSGAERAQQENRLDHVAAGLFYRKCREFAIIERAFGHHAIDRKAELSGNLIERDFGNVTIAAPLMRQ